MAINLSHNIIGCLLNMECDRDGGGGGGGGDEVLYEILFLKKKTKSVFKDTFKPLEMVFVERFRSCTGILI